MVDKTPKIISFLAIKTVHDKDIVTTNVSRKSYVWIY